jgi:hypothetical protein
VEGQAAGEGGAGGAGWCVCVCDWGGNEAVIAGRWVGQSKGAFPRVLEQQAVFKAMPPSVSCVSACPCPCAPSLLPLLLFIFFFYIYSYACSILLFHLNSFY